MNKEIKYIGYSTQPSDYECQDGELAMSLNLVPDNGALNPICPPKKILTLSTQGERIVLIHSVPGQKNFIILREGIDGEFYIWWLIKDLSITDTSPANQIGSYKGYRDIAIVGNTLVIATDNGIKYALWKDDKYIQLRDKPPFITIDFGMYKIATLNSSEKYTIPARCGAKWDQRRSKAEKSELAEFTQMAYSLLLPQITEHVTSMGNFYMPFFVRYAYRLYDGTYTWHSSPILMLPTILPPLIKYSDDGTHPAADGTLNATLTLQVPYFGLAYRILSDGIEELADWSDLVSGIDVFISAPIYTYDQSKDLPWRPVTMTRNVLASVSNDREWYNGDSGRPGWVIADEVFVGHYAESISNEYIDHTMKTDNFEHCLNIQPHPEFHRNIESEHTFYKVVEMDIKDIKAMTQMARLKFKDDDMSALMARPTLSDDYQSHCRLVASSLFAYNSRLSLAGVNITPAEPFPIRSIMQFGNPDGITPIRVRITVWTRLNGVRCYAVHTGENTIECDIWHYPAGNFPRYIYYPDASAYKMEIYISDSEKYILNLTPHDFLNGAYWYRGKDGMSKISTPTENAEAESTDYATSVNVGSKIYTSEVNNPFYFPVTGINTIGTGNIMALSSVVKALSQGQFGQFPLYAFSSEGVWALEVASNGGFLSRQPVTRDVCTNPNSITQIDSAVLFATDRGIMLIQGSVSTCISDSINADVVTSLSDLPSGDRILGLTSFKTSDVDVIPFTEFIKTCRMVYDYPNQRIVVYRPGTKYSYVYSLKSKAWGMMKSDLYDGVASYPEALAVSSERQDDGTYQNFLVDFSQSSADTVECVLLTRPLKLDAVNIHKTIDNIIQRGNFRKGHVQSVVYGSRDLYNWSLIWSSKDHFLRGFRGTPYKYFRVALLCNLSPGESIFGASVQFTPRLTNQPR